MLLQGILARCVEAQDLLGTHLVIHYLTENASLLVAVTRTSDVSNLRKLRGTLSNLNQVSENGKLNGLTLTLNLQKLIRSRVDSFYICGAKWDYEDCLAVTPSK